MTGAKNRNRNPTNTGSTKQLLDALEAADMNAARALLHDRVSFENPILPAIKGKERVGELLDTVFGKLVHKVEFDNVTIAGKGDVVLAERTEVLYLTTSVSLTMPVAMRLTFEDGKIIHIREYFDWATLALALIKMGISLPLGVLGKNDWKKGACSKKEITRRGAQEFYKRHSRSDLRPTIEDSHN